jgi:hypothetical protein
MILGFIVYKEGKLPKSKENTSNRKHVILKNPQQIQVFKGMA